MSTNVIDFQEARKERGIRKLDQAVEDHEDYETLRADLAVSTIFWIVENLYSIDIDIESSPRCVGDLFLIAETVLSLVDRLHEKENSLQSMSDGLVEVSEGVDVPETPFESNEIHKKLLNEFLYGDENED
jgi:hypothetical protein